MKELADKKPYVLKLMCEQHYLSNAELTFALEYLGQTEIVEFEPYLRNVCLDEGKSAVVREGAFCGLLAYDPENIKDVVESFARSSSPGLKYIAKDYA